MIKLTWKTWFAELERRALVERNVLMYVSAVLFSTEMPKFYNFT